MMGYAILYIILLSGVSALCAAVVLFPFWRVYHIVKDRHSVLWEGLGQPEFKKVLFDADTRYLFARIINLSEFSKEEIKSDQDLINYTRACKALINLVPQSLVWSVFWGLFVLVFIFLTTTKLLKVLI